MDLVYGGGSLGLMGEVSEAVHSAGGHVIGSVHTSCYSLALLPIDRSISIAFYLLTVAVFSSTMKFLQLLS
jgi:predicted Rossmann-fold nucleotide-binding protein